MKAPFNRFTAVILIVLIVLITACAPPRRPQRPKPPKRPFTQHQSIPSPGDKWKEAYDTRAIYQELV